MELLDALRTTAAIRDFTDEAVPDEVVARILDTARFAPSGGNAQSWHVVVVRDPQRRRALRDLYLDGWYDYLAMTAAGLRPWAPTNDRDAEAAALPAAAGIAADARAEGLGGVITTMCIAREAEVRTVLDAPDHLALAAVVALGHPVHQPTRLRRSTVGSFTTVDTVTGPPVVGP